jgi:hypothetical protein
VLLKDPTGFASRQDAEVHPCFASILVTKTSGLGQEALVTYRDALHAFNLDAYPRSYRADDVNDDAWLRTVTFPSSPPSPGAR